MLLFNAVVAVSNIFAATDVILASEVNQNFDDIEAALSQLRTGNLAADAGITSRQLAQRFAFFDEPIVLVPYTSGTSLASAGLFTPPTAAMTSIFKKTVRLGGGQECYLSEIELYAARSTVGGGAVYTSFQLLKNSVVVGGAALPVDVEDDYWRLRNADPIANPLIAAQDGDIIELQLHKSDGGQAIAGWLVTLRWKRELVS